MSSHRGTHLVLSSVLLLATACGGSASIHADGPPAAPCLLEDPAASKEPEAAHDHDHSHGHHHTHGSLDPEDRSPQEQGTVVLHERLVAYEHQGNELVGIATPSLGAREHEVWRARIAVGSETPLHTHESEEIFVFLKGRGRARIGQDTFAFSAPATVIAPAGLPHQFFNTGNEPTEAIVIVRPESRITDAAGGPLDLPWRR